MTQQSKSRQTRPEVQEVVKPKRRPFTVHYKRSILEQADACSKSGELRALLRREGLYSSQLHHLEARPTARRTRRPRTAKRGPKPKKFDPRDQRIAALEKELAKERARRKRTEGEVYWCIDGGGESICETGRRHCERATARLERSAIGATARWLERVVEVVENPATNSACGDSEVSTQ